jgi:uncharacterized protein YpuA (DUF1002 family)
MTKNSTSQQLYSEWRKLLNELKEVKSSWDDEVSRNFLDRFVDPMGATFKELLDSLEQMEESISKAERDIW